MLVTSQGVVLDPAQRQQGIYIKPVAAYAMDHPLHSGHIVLPSSPSIPAHSLQHSTSASTSFRGSTPGEGGRREEGREEGREGGREKEREGGREKEREGGMETDDW